MRKSQAALEFLTTYGWAFLVILVMIGALAYFGILSPTKFLPNRCNFGAEFQCIDYQINGATNNFRLKLRSNVGETITISSMDISVDAATQDTCAPLAPAAYPWADSWKTGNVSDFTWQNCAWTATGFSSGDKGKVFVTVRYYSVSSGANYMKEVKGEIYSSVI